MPHEIERSPRLAILIDADNASPRIAKALFEEVASIGEASVRRIYGDFSGTRLKGWSEALAPYAIIPQQTPANTAGKNASDIAMVIDAMDLLHTGRFGGFCLVSSDGDFTRLAARIREHGVDVYGFGERKAPESFRQACKRFIYTENLMPPCEVPVASQTEQGGPLATSASKSPPQAAVAHILTAIEQLDDTNGWYFLGAVGNRLSALMPDFDSRSYGCSKMVTLIEKSEAFEIRRDNLMVYVRPQATAAISQR